MKSLDQIEARTPISSAPFTITQPGSYYLTTNVTVSSGDAITITANDVTLDLNGFTISSTAPVANSDNAILLSGSRTNIAIRNGHISSGVTNNGAGVYSGTGFGFGVIFSGFPSNVRVSGLSVSGCQYDGIYLGYNSTVVESCVVNTVGAYGILAQSISDSTANDCGTTAISATTANNCIGSVSGSGSGVYATAANNCFGTSTTGGGVNANTANNCYGYSSGSGIGVSASVADHCIGLSNTGTGVSADTAENCKGQSTANNTTGDGVHATAALNCYGASAGSGRGVHAVRSAKNCYGSSIAGFGVEAYTAESCWGSSTNSSGISATIAQNCYAYTIDFNGVDVYIAENCTGETTSGMGVAAVLALNCYGYAYGGGAGLNTRTAIGCYGFSHSGTGLIANIANSCSGATDTGTAQTIVNKYNMP